MFEKFSEAPQEEETHSNQKKSSKGGRLFRKYLGAAALGAAALTASAEAQNRKPGPSWSELKIETSANNKITGSDEHFEIRAKDSLYTWGIQYIPKEKDGLDYLGMRYLKVNNKTGGSEILGEFEDIYEEAEGVKKIPDLPEEMKAMAADYKKIMDTEKSYERSGLTESNGNVNGKHKIEERTFEGYGIKVKNKVEVDEKGNVVKILESHPITDKEKES